MPELKKKPKEREKLKKRKGKYWFRPFPEKPEDYSEIEPTIKKIREGMVRAFLKPKERKAKKELPAIR